MSLFNWLSLTCAHIESISWALRKEAIILNRDSKVMQMYTNQLKNIKTKKSLSYITY